MQLSDAVASCLGEQINESRIEAALRLLCEELQVDRFSLHAVDPGRGSFRVVAGGGGQILAPGTELPLETSTQVAVPAGGDVFRHASFGDAESFDRSLDHLVVDMGYRSGCSIPLFVGSRPVGALCASSRDPHLDCDAVLDAMHDVSVVVTEAFRGARTTAPRILVCADDELFAEGVARIVERSIGARAELCATRDDALSLPPARYEAIICDATFDGRPIASLLADLDAGDPRRPVPALVIATRDTPMSRTLAARSRATGYVAGSAGSAAIASAVRSLVAGDEGAAPDLEPDADGTLPHLTPQERNVLVLLERGLRFKQIAADMHITESTAKGYARNLFAKLDAHSRSEAVYEARRQGLLDFLAGA
ncbi:LuxR C-terminal-related transcriptional regulator [Baekduia soli]|nr:LuxR C-terminal-related transcriptional regulator [Baekduia soli]